LHSVREQADISYLAMVNGNGQNFQNLSVVLACLVEFTCGGGGVSAAAPMSDKPEAVI
jgi:hypothetical protein